VLLSEKLTEVDTPPTLAPTV
jgi:hypothetical protein